MNNANSKRSQLGMTLIELLVVVAIVLSVYSFPKMFQISAYLTVVFVVGLVGLLTISKLFPEKREYLHATGKIPSKVTPYYLLSLNEFFKNDEYRAP